MLLAACGLAPRAQADEPPARSVLLLQSYDRGSALVQHLTDGVVSVLSKSRDFTFDYRFEYMGIFDADPSGWAEAYRRRLSALSFDIVICSAARKYVRDGAKLVREFLRFLGPGGSLAVVDPHPWALGLGVRLGKFDRGYLHHRSNAAEIAAEMPPSQAKSDLESWGVDAFCTTWLPSARQL